MKKVITTMACLTIAIMPNMACSDLDNRESDVKQTLSTQVKNFNTGGSLANRTVANADSKYIYDSSMLLIEEIQNNENLLNAIRNPQVNPDGSLQFINQDTLDSLLILIDFEESIDLQTINLIIAKSIDAYSDGYQSTINNMKFSPEATYIFNDMLNVETQYSEVTDYPSFYSLNQNEQDLAQNVFNFSSYSRIQFEYVEAFFWLSGGIVTGAMIGGAFGPGGALIGAIIGGAVGVVCHLVSK